MREKREGEGEGESRGGEVGMRAEEERKERGEVRRSHE